MTHVRDLVPSVLVSLIVGRQCSDRDEDLSLPDEPCDDLDEVLNNAHLAPNDISQVEVYVFGMFADLEVEGSEGVLEVLDEVSSVLDVVFEAHKLIHGLGLGILWLIGRAIGCRHLTAYAVSGRSGRLDGHSIFYLLLIVVVVVVVLMDEKSSLQRCFL